MVEGAAVSHEELDAGIAGANRALTTPQLAPLHIEVPTSGVHFRFEKLYANQSEESAAFSMPYTSKLGATLGQALALLGTALFWTGVSLALWRGAPLDTQRSLGLAGVGLILLLLPISYLQTSATPPLILSFLLLLGGAARYGRDWLGRVLGSASADA